MTEKKDVKKRKRVRRRYIMKSMSRILAIDPGEVRWGLAICDVTRMLASPLETYTRKGSARDAAYLRKVVADEDVKSIVIGLPMHTDGREGVQAEKARAFGAQVAEWTGLPIAFYDERFTTRIAERELWNAGLSHKRRKERRDRVAAQMMLQAYLEAGCPDG